MEKELNKYPDGTSYMDVSKDSSVDKVFRINSYEDLWHLNQYVDAFNSMGFVPHITIPCLLDAQADRRFGYGQSSGLKLVCEFLSKMRAQFEIFHPHNPEVVEALLSNCTITDNSVFIKTVLQKLGEEFPYISISKERKTKSDNLILMSSDAGGFKPLMKLCDKIEWQGETTSASKYRNHGNPLVQVLDKDDYEKKDILIIDDISVYGGTFKGLSKLLRERNCGKLYLAVSHMTIQDLGEDPVTNYFDKVFTTNSKFDNYTCVEDIKAFGGTYTENRNQPKNLEIIKLFK